MTDDLRAWLLGSRFADPGCDACFDVLDQYAETLLRGGDVTQDFPEVLAHLASCEACREDTEGLLAALQDARPGSEPR